MKPNPHKVGAPFWIGCVMTPFLFAWTLSLLLAGDGFLLFMTSVIFAPVVGLGTQALTDLIRIHQTGRLRWWDGLAFAVVLGLAATYGFAVYHFPAAQMPIRYGLVGLFPVVVAYLYARTRILIRFYHVRRHKQA
jgi:hypothetical protein